MAKQTPDPVLTDPTVEAPSLPAGVPDVPFQHGDDQCNCTFQDVREWTNPYLGRTLRARMCCIYGELFRQFPQFVQDIPAHYDAATHSWVPDPQPWDSEDADMPEYLWHRHKAALTGKALAEVREEHAGAPHERPRAVAPGMGRASRPQPDEATLAAAHEARMKASGWTAVPDAPMSAADAPDMPQEKQSPDA